MKAICLRQFGGPEVLEYHEDFPIPVPGDQDVLIRVKAAGVNPVDWKIREGLLQGRLPHTFPLIPGWDAAGVVEAVGDGTNPSSLKPGDEVYAYCRKPLIQQGTYAEYCTMTMGHVVRKPSVLSFSEAASIPLAGLTAYQSLVDAAKVGAGQTVLIHAGAGGVGGFAIQIAKHLGATVITTGSAEKHAYLCALGADVVIDYTAGDFREAVSQRYPDGVDVAFDTVGGDVQRASADCVKSGGALVSILALEHEAYVRSRGVEPLYVFVAPNGPQLARLASWIEQGALKTRIAGSYPLQEAAEAHRAIQTGRTAGKLVLTIDG